MQTVDACLFKGCRAGRNHRRRSAPFANTRPESLSGSLHLPGTDGRPSPRHALGAHAVLDKAAGDAAANLFLSPARLRTLRRTGHGCTPARCRTAPHDNPRGVAGPCCPARAQRGRSALLMAAIYPSAPPGATIRPPACSWALGEQQRRRAAPEFGQRTRVGAVEDRGEGGGVKSRQFETGPMLAPRRPPRVCAGRRVDGDRAKLEAQVKLDAASAVVRAAEACSPKGARVAKRRWDARLRRAALRPTGAFRSMRLRLISRAALTGRSLETLPRS